MVVGLHGIVPPTDADKDVRGHVNHVSFARHETSEPLGARHRRFWVHRFDCMDVVMTRTGVVWIAREDALELAYGFLRARVGSSVRAPVVPRTEIHQ